MLTSGSVLKYGVCDIMLNKKDARNINNKVDMVGHLIMERKGLFKKEKKVVVVIHQVFLEYLKNHVQDEKVEQELTKAVTQQAVERYDMLNNSQNPFYGDEEGFEHYRRVKYKMLYDHIEHMLTLARSQKIIVEG